MNTLKNFVVVAVLVTFVAFAASAQQGPAYKDGDWCEYRNSFNNTLRQTVSMKADGGYILTSEGDGVQREIREYNAAGKMVKKDALEFKPFWASEDFPVKVGATGPLGEFTYTWSGGTQTTAKANLDSVTLEKVSVPAGTFEAVVVRVSYNFTRTNGRSGVHRGTTWYDAKAASTWPLKQEYVDGISRSNNWEKSVIRCGSPLEAGVDNTASRL